MNSIKLWLGWLGLLVISLLPAWVWLFYGEGFVTPYTYGSLTHNLGEVTGLVGMTMFAMTFVLSTRISWIEDVFGGLDKVYITHGILGGSALILILTHPLLLVAKFIPSDVVRAATYLLPSAFWSVNFGIVALLVMVALIVLTLFSKLKYHHWKFTHEFMGLAFFFAVLHTLLIRTNVSQDYIFSGYYIYVAIVGLVGLLSFAYSLFLKRRIFRNAEYTVKSIISNETMHQITLEPQHKPIAYTSGQFVFVRFYNEQLTPEAHPYSIASDSNAREIVLIIKKLGDHTSSLERLQTGDRVELEGPYGRFIFHGYAKREQVWIAGGIGITPFLSMAQDVSFRKIEHEHITLFHAVKNASEFIGDEYLQTLSDSSKQFSFIPWQSEVRGYLNVNEIEELCGDLGNKEFFLCGSPMMKQGIINDLLERGVPKRRIHEEAFDLL